MAAVADLQGKGDHSREGTIHNLPRPHGNIQKIHVEATTVALRVRAGPLSTCSSQSSRRAAEALIPGDPCPAHQMAGADPIRALPRMEELILAAPYRVHPAGDPCPARPGAVTEAAVTAAGPQVPGRQVADRAVAAREEDPAEALPVADIHRQDTTDIK